MQTVVTIIIALIVFVGLYYLITYNKLIGQRNRVQSAYSGIDVQLKKRWDLIPRLIEVTKGYAAHEKKLFETVVNARNQAMNAGNNQHERFAHEETLNYETPRIIALAESYPELKSNEQFLMLQRNLTEIESQISAARRSFNASVLIYNNSIQTYPSSIIAAKHAFKEMDFFSINTEERNNVKFSS